jgi:hypothetical protein
LEAGRRYAKGKIVPSASAKALLEAVIHPGDRVCLEGDNQKQADFLAEVLAGVDPSRIHDLHIVQSDIVLQAHLDLFEQGIARKLDFSYSVFEPLTPMFSRIAVTKHRLRGGRLRSASEKCRSFGARPSRW